MSEHRVLITAYVPHLPADSWEEMREAVLSAVTAYSRGRSEACTRHALSTATGYVHWARENGLAFSPEQALNAGLLIDTYVADRSRQIRPYRAEREGTVLRELCGTPARSRRTRATVDSPPDAPYTVAQAAEARTWATYQATALRRRNALALTALGFGCGLTSHEMLHAHGRDLARLADGMMGVVLQGDGPRSIPALADWSSDLEELRDLCLPDEWLIAPGWSDRTSHTLNDIRKTLPGIAPSPRRMRNTWLVTQVNAGTPVPVIMRTAGLAEAAFLRRLAPYIDMPAAHVQRAMLRGGGAHA